jgi:hypothetical protein
MSRENGLPDAAGTADHRVMRRGIEYQRLDLPGDLLDFGVTVEQASGEIAVIEDVRFDDHARKHVGVGI